ncbi:MAG TPA: acetylglutamate kinase [Dehalococcoidia bacterium]|nr:acetylglutamate kinase [Dehalococcoidia bacterium]
MSESPILVVKIGGSTLGSHDTTLEDLVALRGQGWRPLVVHGGGAAISEWLKVHDTPTRFVRGLRVTDAASLRVVVAVLAGLINKELVAAINALGGRAIGLSGADGGLIRVSVLDPELGYVGQIERVDGGMLKGLLDEGYLPVVAPLGILWEEGPRNQIMNINADTVAGEVALALGAHWLVFLTDVPGIAGGDGRSLARLSIEEAVALVEEGVVSGGMIPKVEACLRAATGATRTAIIDGRQPHALVAALERGELAGTIITTSS